MENFDENSINRHNDGDMAFFERDALAYKIMEGNPKLSYEEACKEALRIIKMNKDEEKNEKN